MLPATRSRLSHLTRCYHRCTSVGRPFMLLYVCTTLSRCHQMPCMLPWQHSHLTKNQQSTYSNTAKYQVGTSKHVPYIYSIYHPAKVVAPPSVAESRRLPLICCDCNATSAKSARCCQMCALAWLLLQPGQTLSDPVNHCVAPCRPSHVLPAIGHCRFQMPSCHYRVRITLSTNMPNKVICSGLLKTASALLACAPCNRPLPLSMQDYIAEVKC